MYIDHLVVLGKARHAMLHNVEAWGVWGGGEG